MKQPEKTCAICGNKFKQYRSTQRVCSYQCTIEHENRKAKEKAKNDALKDKPETRALTASGWKLKLRDTFNKYIRLRDRHKGCVSCERSLVGVVYDAGHFFASTFEGIRFNECNVHGQCIDCNRMKGSNNEEYKKRITNRITPDQLKWLEDHKHDELRLTIPEMKQLIDHYENEIKQLENAY